MTTSAVENASDDSTPAVDINRFGISATVMLATVMIIVDMTIVNVTLPDMMGALGATSDQVTWVLTSYIVAEAITIPLSGYLAGRFGRKRLILVSVSGFVIMSMLCGQATSLAEMVFFRLLQGAFGASVIPISQSIMVDSFPAEQRGKAMAIWGIGVMLGPVLGPTIGGIVTDHLDWRWVFYINLPVGLLSLALIMAFIPTSQRKAVPVDLLGAAMLAVGIGSLQTLLDRGNQENWLDSHFIFALLITSILCLVYFAWRSLQRQDAILKISLLKDRNLATASGMMLAFGLGLFGTIALQPIMMGNLYGYPAETIGFVMAPRGLAAAFGMLVVALLSSHLSPRVLILTGLVLAATGTWAMTQWSLAADSFDLAWPGVLQGVGMGMIFVSLSSLAYQTLAKADTDQGSSLFNLSRTIGSSIGISITSTLLSRASQQNWNILGGQINEYNPAVSAWLSARDLSMNDPLAIPLLAQELSRQAGMVAFTQSYAFIAISFLLLAPFVLLLNPGKAASAVRSMH